MKTKKNTGAFLFCIPGLLILAIFVYFPLIENIMYSFQSFSLSSTTKEFAGLANYKELFSDPIIWQSIKNNLLYAVVSIIMQVMFGLVVAAILEDKNFYNELLYIMGLHEEKKSGNKVISRFKEGKRQDASLIENPAEFYLDGQMVMSMSVRGFAFSGSRPDVTGQNG